MILSDMYKEFSLYGFDDLTDSQKLLLLNESYFDIVTREPWPFLESLVTLTVPAATSKVTNNSFSGSPTDVNSVLSLVDVTNNIVVVPERTDVVQKNYFLDKAVAFPDRYYFVGDDLYLYPATSASTKYNLFYTRIPTEAITTSDTFMIPSRHHSVIIYGALVKAYLVNDDPQAAMFQNMFESRYQQMRNDVWMNQYDRTDRIHVLTDSYDWNY